MEAVALDPGVFIRSLATRGSLGGLSGAAREVCDVLDGAGFDVILLETVGVGQSELDVSRATTPRSWCSCPRAATRSRPSRRRDGDRRRLLRQQGRPPRSRPAAQRHRADARPASGRGVRRRAAHHGVDLAALAKDPAHRDFVRDALNPARAARREAAGEQTDGWTPPVLRSVAAKDEGSPRCSTPSTGTAAILKPAANFGRGGGRGSGSASPR
jgi:LAO/AO transport system kinase